MLTEAEDVFHQAMQYTQFSPTPQSDRAALQEGKFLIHFARMHQDEGDPAAIIKASASANAPPLKDAWQLVREGLRSFLSDSKKVEAMTVGWKTLVPHQCESLLEKVQAFGKAEAEDSEAHTQHNSVSDLSLPLPYSLI